MAENNQTIRIPLSGRIDSGNAADVEKTIMEQLAGRRNVAVVLDATDLEYISSAGLRVLLRIKKAYPNLTITDVRSEVYEILEMTGFTEMMDIKKAYRVVSVDGCEVIGRGANGTVYRIDKDNVVKVYNNADALDEIQHEREVARLALVLGIPTAISYDVIKVGDSYGSVFELLDATSFAKILANEPEKLNWCVKEFVDMLKLIHRTEVPEGKLPDMKETVLSWAAFMQDYLPEEAGKKLISMVEEVPHSNHMLHGDYHTGNLMVQNGEVLVIDMDTLAVGHPIFELASIYNALIGYSEIDNDTIMRFQGYSLETGKKFWHAVLSSYLQTSDEERIQAVEKKARIIGYTRLVRRSIRRGGLDDETARKEIEFWKAELLELLDEVDTLLFDPNELEVQAVTENLQQVLTFIENHLEAADCPPKAQMQITLAAEEIFVNIANYAYAPEKGVATVRIEVSEDPVTVTITFIDHGIPYDPLAKEDPDVTLSAEERGIGGLGIFMVKQTMDDVSYAYHNGQNILTLKKKL